jgi:hypothetical protein
MVKNNYAIAARHYSYQVLRNQLSGILQSFFGDDIEHLRAQRRPARSKGYLYINSHQVMYKHIDSQRSRPRAK